MDGELKIPQLPDLFVRRAAGQLGDELPSFLSAMDDDPVRGLRMNPFRTGIPVFRDAERKIPWEKNGWEIPLSSRAGATAEHEAGAFYLQEPCAMIPARALDARPGEKILDLCAAPGGKSTQIGADMMGKGLLVCNEPVAKRAAVLSSNLERMGIVNSIAVSAYPEKLASRWPEGFDGVLVDAPCSGEGMFRRHPDTRAEWSAEKAEGCAARQKQILDAAARMVRPGGRLVYSTCTWNPAENEEQVELFLREHRDFFPEPFFLPGAEAPEGMLACWLHRTRGEGQFTAKLRRRGSGEAVLPSGKDAFRISREVLQSWRQSGVRTPEPGALFGQTAVCLPEIPDLTEIRVLRLGLHLGQIRKGIFWPDHAAALAMERPEMPEMELTDAEALKYLAGETTEGESRGWTLMTWKGLVLGWAKGSCGEMKNHYPKGLRNTRLET